MRITDLHVLFDHFSVALVVAGIIAEFIAITRQTDSTFGWTALRVGGVMMLLSVLSGFVAEEKSFMDSATHPLGSYHKVISIVAFALLIGGILLRSTSRDGFTSARSSGVRGAYFTLLVLTFVMTGVSVYLGIELVYEHGVNVRPYERLIESLPAGEPSVTAPADTAHSDSVRH